MGCVNPDGSITSSGKQMLQLLQQPHSAEDAAAQSGQPLFKVRSSLREMVEAGLVEETDGRYRATDAASKFTGDS